MSDLPMQDLQHGLDIGDDEWHMLTITTHIDGGRGFELYIDGVMRGSLSQHTSRSTNGSNIDIDPIQVSHFLKMVATQDFKNLWKRLDMR